AALTAVFGRAQRNWPDYWPRHCFHAARERWRTAASERACGRSSEVSRGAGFDNDIARSFVGRQLRNRNRREWLSLSEPQRIAALRATRGIPRHYCPDAQSTWRYGFFRHADH